MLNNNIKDLRIFNKISLEFTEKKHYEISDDI